MIHRILRPLPSNSFFLFGARGTGKTTFLREFIGKKKVLWIDLLNSEEEALYLRSPSELKSRLAAHPEITWVVIDEIQKVPRLLDVVHQLIESTDCKFALTGSSARKLKRGGANLLAGRAFLNTLYPLTATELGDRFDVDDYLTWGGMPMIQNLKTATAKKAYLKTFVHTFLREEIISEQVVRKLEPFRRFLEVAAQTSGEILNFSNVAKDVGADTKTVQSYYQILEDTLVGFFLPAFHQSLRRQQRQAAKFYLFDNGVKRALSLLLDLKVQSGTYEYGRAFEHLVVSEIMRLSDYKHREFKFSYLRTQNQMEIDLIVERPGKATVMVEIKSAAHVDERDLKTLKLFLGDIRGAKGYCLSLDPNPKVISGIRCLPWLQGVQEIVG